MCVDGVPLAGCALHELRTLLSSPGCHEVSVSVVEADTETNTLTAVELGLHCEALLGIFLYAIGYIGL